ncbi:hypothetical protein [Campylobacter blaseri]|uniref:Uncharacterized protein n=1 Tax=Campylobacter blaseri TaxID=2042961 RepID=A0A2P8QYI8_9BACT|nr:hypothetical protein [Campylobacter blaseri]PSM51301.1 hypothetical protein CQ405_08710 [Campylobacter blaseri]PSM52445.1 hypothetical protein CRN67_08715 [Campylobacter blaseri]
MENKTASYNNFLYNIILTLEPQKRRDKTNSYAFSIDVKNFKIEILDYELYSMSQKELMTLSYVCEIINENPSGIAQSKLTRRLQKIAREDYVEIVGLNALWNLLKKNNNNKFIIEKIRGQGRSGYTNFYKPL